VIRIAADTEIQSPITFVVVQSMNDVAEEDCEFFHFSRDQLVEISF
jgi:hypothetical protein